MKKQFLKHKHESVGKPRLDYLMRFNSGTKLSASDATKEGEKTVLPISRDIQGRCATTERRPAVHRGSGKNDSGPEGGLHYQWTCVLFLVFLDNGMKSLAVRL